jgi:CHAT domain-containing protein/tetratricopeptide (TPR) repeat protein
MKLFFVLTISFFYSITVFSQTKFEEMKKQYEDFRKIEKHDSALAVAKRMNKWVFKIEKDTSLHYAVSFRYIGNSYSSLKLKDSAIFYCNLSLQKLETQNRKYHIEYASSLYDLGFLNKQFGDYKDAESSLKQSLEIRRKLLGVENLDYLSSLNELANLYTFMGDYDVAEVFLKQCIEIRKKRFGEKNLEYASSLNDLAYLYKERRDFKLAEPIYKQSIEIRKKILGTENHYYASSINDLATLYREIGNYTAAEPLYKESLEIKRKISGEESLEYASCLISLGILYRLLGNYTNAETYLKQSLEIREKKLGNKHPDFASCLSNLAQVNIATSNLEIAESLLKKSLEIYKIKLGEEHPKYAGVLLPLGIVYRRMGNYKACESAYKEYLLVIKKLKGGDSAEYAKGLNNLAVVYTNMNNYVAAEINSKQSLEILKITIGEENLTYSRGLNTLGELYTKMGRYSDAESLLKKSLEIQKKIIGINSPNITENLLCLGKLYTKMGNYSAAELLYNQLLEIQKNILGKENIKYIISLNDLADLYVKTNRYKEANTIYQNNFEIIKNEIVSNFEWLTDNEKDAYWKKYDTFFETIHEFSNLSNNENTNISQLNYNAALFTKSKLLETKISEENFYNEIAATRERLSFLRKKLAKMNEDSNGEEYKKIESEANELNGKLTQSWPEFAQEINNLSITWNQVQNNLSKDEVAIEFVRYKVEKDSSYHYDALIIRKSDLNPILVNLCTEKQLKGINPKEGFSSFYPLVWAPLEEYLKNINTIYYSPIGILNNIPFHALYSKKTDGDNIKKSKDGKSTTISELNAEFLINKYTLHQLTSSRYLAMGIKEKATEKIEKSITLVGGVDYDYLPGNKIEIKKGADFVTRGSNTKGAFQFLDGTKLEVETINKTLKLTGWETSLLEQNEATEENIEKLENHNAKGVLHIATHGFAFEEAIGNSTLTDDISIRYKLSNNSNPMKRCGLIFAGANWAWTGSDEYKKLNPEAEDGILTAAQVALLNLKKTKLVVLSACETGLGKIEGGEGVFGLKRAFKLAGVEQIIVSLWEVADKETMELMTLFYEDLVKTQNAIVSFEKAQKTMKDNYPTRPDLWAGFVLVR